MVWFQVVRGLALALYREYRYGFLAHGQDAAGGRWPGGWGVGGSETHALGRAIREIASER